MRVKASSVSSYRDWAVAEPALAIAIRPRNHVERPAT